MISFNLLLNEGHSAKKGKVYFRINIYQNLEHKHNLLLLQENTLDLETTRKLPTIYFSLRNKSSFRTE